MWAMCTNIVCYIRDVGVCRFWYSWKRGPGSEPPWYRGITNTFLGSGGEELRVTAEGNSEVLNLGDSGDNNCRDEKPARIPCLYLVYIEEKVSLFLFFPLWKVEFVMLLIH